MAESGSQVLPAKAGTTAAANAVKPQPQSGARPKRPQRPNYAKIHANPLPLATHPLPAFIPQSPLSALRIAYILIRDYFLPPTSHLPDPYIGYFSAETRSVHVTDPLHVRALWEMGFFGKGTLSRSEPSWLEREKARRVAGKEGGTSEEATRKRREERRLFKLERARLEREKIEQQLREERRLNKLNEAGLGVKPEAKGAEVEETERVGLGHVFPCQSESTDHDSKSDGESLGLKEAEMTSIQSQDVVEPPPEAIEQVKETGVARLNGSAHANNRAQEDEAPQAQETELINQEHLQLTLEEAFFLAYGLGVLSIHHSPPSKAQSPLLTLNLPIPEFFNICRQHSTFPTSPLPNLAPDDPFLLHYVVYHHYRSLGWVVRPGVKFSCDYLLYNRGPVFSHAEFAVLIVPEYSAESGKKTQMDWWWLHAVNRVQSQVRKSLVICYVNVPDGLEGVEGLNGQGELNVGAVLRRYKVREFVIRRWLANRSRD